MLPPDLKTYRMAMNYLAIIEHRLGDCPTTTQVIRDFNLSLDGKLSPDTLLNQMSKIIDQFDTGTTIANGDNATK